MIVKIKTKSNNEYYAHLTLNKMQEVENYLNELSRESKYLKCGDRYFKEMVLLKIDSVESIHLVEGTK